MVKLASGLFLLATTVSMTWTGWRSAAASTPPSAPPPAVVYDPFASEAAVRHRQGLPNHWRGYMLQPRR